MACTLMSISTCPIKGYKDVEAEISKIRSRKLTYTIFEVCKVDPVELRVSTSNGIDNSFNLRSTPSEKELLSVFDQCKSQLKESSASFIAYNFGYYSENNNYREMIMLVSFIPENVNLRHKIAMTSNTAALQSALQIPVHLEAHELDDFTFTRLMSECVSIQRK